MRAGRVEGRRKIFGIERVVVVSVVVDQTGLE
jgi:hypothetical protein